MKKVLRASASLWLAWGVATSAVANSFPTFCQAMPWLRDNLTVKADVPDGALRIDKEGSFRVYLLNTMTGFSFFDAKLGIFSDQFDAEVTPSPTWKTFPDIAPAAKKPSAARGSAEYFTVTLKRKSGVADGAYDILIKLYARAHNFQDHALATTLTLGEALDAQTVPVRASVPMDGKPAPTAWAGSLLVKDFLAYQQNGKGVMSFGPASPTRIHVAADADNLYLLAHFMGEGKNGEIQMYVASGIEDTPKVVTLDQATGKVSADAPMDGAQCVRCGGSADASDAMYEARIPLAALGLSGKKSFFLNFARIDRHAADDPNPEISFWRGNAVSVNQPVVYAHARLDTQVAAVPATAQPPAAGPATRDDFGESFVPCVLPADSAIAADGQISPSEWANAFVLASLRPYSKEGDQWRSGKPELSRIQLAADKDNLYVLFTFLTRSEAGSLKLLVAPDAKATPVWIGIDRRQGKLRASIPTDGMVAVRCNDDDFLRSPPSRAAFFSSVAYECRIPRKALGIEGKQTFLANAEFDDYPAYWTAHGNGNPPLWRAYWRGNPDTAADPATYGRFAFSK